MKKYKLSGNEGYRERFGVVFQDFRLFAMSVTDNVLLRRRSDGDDETANRALKRSGISDKIATFEMGSEAVLTREFDPNGKVLSGGEAQKISIARIFARDFEVIVMDEPSSTLDPIAEYELNQTILSYVKEKTVIFISHRFSTTRAADRIVMLENGRIIEDGSHNELMKQNGKYAVMFTMQARKCQNSI